MSVPHPVSVTEKPCSQCKTVRPASEFSRDPRNKSGLSSTCHHCFREYQRLKKAGMFIPVSRPAIYTEEGKLCSKCKTRKPLADFSRNRAHAGGYANYCKICLRASASPETKRDYYKMYWPQYYANNRDRRLEATRQYYRANKTRLKPVRAAWEARNSEKATAKRNEWAIRNDAHRKAANRAYYLQNKQEYRRRGHIRRTRHAQNGGSFTLEEWFDVCYKYDYRCLRCGQHKPLTVDHVLPIALGGTSNIDNIQPLCLKCNISKNAKHVDYRLHC